MDRRFGIEIEMYAPSTHNAYAVAAAITSAGVLCKHESYNHETRTWWKIVSDASVNGRPNGMELVSPPLSGTEGFRQVQVVSEVLVRLGCKVDVKCGLHVHLDATDLTVDAWKSIVRTYTKYEAHFDSMMPVSRRANTYAKTMSQARLSLLDACPTIRDIAMNVFYGDRFYKVNAQSYLRHGTIEFRQHSGTVEAQKIIPWVRFLMGIVNKANRPATQALELKVEKKKMHKAIHVAMTSRLTVQGLRDLVGQKNPARDFYRDARALGLEVSTVRDGSELVYLITDTRPVAAVVEEVVPTLGGLLAKADADAEVTAHVTARTARFARAA